jgi:hypothetical protein
MPDQLQLRGGTTVQHSTFTGASKEVTVDTTKKTAVVHDGSTVGGNPLMRENASNSALALGSAATPSLKFTGDTNTGIYSPGADQVAVSTGGVQRINIEADGDINIDGGGVFYDATNNRLAIGTTSPSSPFVVSDGGAGGVELHGNSSGDGRLLAYNRSGAAYIGMRYNALNHQFLISDTERVRIDSSGRLLVGTSSTSDNALIQIQGRASLSTGPAEFSLSKGALPSSGENIAVIKAKDNSGNIGASIVAAADANWTSGTSHPTRLMFSATAAGASSPTERMRIDSSGRVGIGVTSPADIFNIKTASSRHFVVRSGGSPKLYSQNDSGNVEDLTIGGNNLYFFTGTGASGTEKARLDSSGRLLVGTPTALDTGSNSLLQVLHESGPRIFLSNGQVSSNELLGAIVFGAAEGGGYDAASVAAYAEDDFNPNDYPSRLVFSTTADNAASPTERMRIDSNGDTFFGTTAHQASASSGSGGHFISSPGSFAAFARSSGNCMFVNRISDDGTLIDFRQNGTTEGTISVSGTTVSYNGAHLSRWSQIPGIDAYNKAVRPEILRGTVMSNLDEMCDWACPTSGDCQDNEQLNKTKISDVEGDKNVAGIFQSWDDDDDTWVNDFYLAMTGDFVIRIAAGTTVERGDLLMSAGDGTAKPQADDLVRSCTVAKVTSTTVSCTHPDGSYCVPCVLMAC